MSWQRILETARRQGIPVIVTDVAGRDPMVVMPFEAFEMLSEAGMPTAPRKTSRKIPVSSEPVREEVRIEDVAQAPSEAPSASEKFEKIEETPGVSEGDLSLEERFYLEPVEEGEVR